ncbi:Negative elongation factor B [Sarcoptes scabiei]|uniref:Negative elongation factor B n=1 Tax=Sarcoptes scabiei TaxID=52283 RepID=A0A834VA07_SARSC|nr:Negative elongation factor B [Sarcoptes scabiei]UXI17549.1 hypothetical protein NH340_JMT03492 [Sarcoptes scabiei]
MSEEIHFINDLEEIGITGKKGLRSILFEAFNSNEIPFEEIIETFQQNNRMILPSLSSILPLLYSMGLRSLDFHQSVMKELREMLINRIENIANSTTMTSQAKDSTLMALLEKSFPLIKVPMLQPVVMVLLKNIENISDKYLQLLVADESLYNKCDVSVKRHIWQENSGLLINALSPILSDYIKEKEAIFANLKESRQSFFLLTPKQRRQNKELRELANMVGKNVILYDTILQFLRTVYLHTKNPHYCTLRVSLLMELHDESITDITSMDACHKFAWCLDACIRENTVDIKRVRELQGFLDNVKKGNESLWGDMAMALIDPYAINFLVQTVMRILNNQIINEACPRDHQTLQFLLRLLNLGLHAHEIIRNQSFREPRFNPELLTRFLPIIMGFMVDDQVRSVNSKLPPDDRESALTIIEHSGPPPDIFQTFILREPLAATIAVYYTAHAARQKDFQAVMRVIGSLTIGSTLDNFIYTDTYQHVLVSGLINLGEEFSNQNLCSLVFNEIFFPAMKLNNTAVHMIKLIYHVHQWMPKEELEECLSNLEQFSYSPEAKENITNAFRELMEHLEKLKEEKESKSTTQQAQSSASNENLNSVSTRIVHPMMTPAPHAYMSPSPSMSPYYSAQPAGSMTPMSPYAIGTMSPIPYQSPFHNPGTSKLPPSGSRPSDLGYSPSAY